MLIRRPKGFSFAEIVVALAIIAILTAVILPGLTLRMRGAQAANIIQDMRAVSAAIQQYRENVGRYPSNLGQLTSNEVSQTDLCGNALPANLTALWRGPYIALDLASSTAIASGDAIFKLPLVRNPTTAGPAYTALDGFMQIDIEQVDSLAAETIEAAFDGFSAIPTRINTGTVRWGKTGGATGLGSIGVLIYRLPIRGC